MDEVIQELRVAMQQCIGNINNLHQRLCAAEQAIGLLVSHTETIAVLVRRNRPETPPIQPIAVEPQSTTPSPNPAPAATRSPPRPDRPPEGTEKMEFKQ